MPKYLSLFALILALCFKNSAQAFVANRGGAELLNAKASAFSLNSSYFQTMALFDEEGTKKPLNEGDSFKMINADLKVSYGIASNLEASLMLRLRNLSGMNQKFSFYKSGAESVGIESKYSFPPVGNTHYALGVYYRQTLYSNTDYPTVTQVPVDQIILGDDGTEYGVGLFITHNESSWKYNTMAQYVSPPNDLSSEVQYMGEAQYLRGQMALVVGVEGIYSLNRNQLDQKPNLARGPTNIFNSLNRQMISPYVGFNYSFDSVLVSLKGSSVVAGRSTDNGFASAIGFSWSTQGITAESIKIESFKEYHIEASVLKVSARGNFIKIDQGLSTDVEKGMKFDIYQTDYFGGNVLVGSGLVYDIGADWSVIKLVKKYKEIEIKPGFAARGY